MYVCEREECICNAFVCVRECVCDAECVRLQACAWYVSATVRA